MDVLIDRLWGTDLKSLLDQFAKQVANNVYHKMNYDDYRYLKKEFQAAADQGVMDSGSYRIVYNHESITIYDPNDYPMWESYVRDSSFGSFLFDIYYEDIEGELMNLERNFTATLADCAEVANSAGATLAGNTYTIGKSYRYDAIVAKADTGTAIADTKVDKDEFRFEMDAVKARLEKYQETVAQWESNERKENEKMKFGNFDFGRVTGNNVRMSMYGLAVKNPAGKWVAYDKNTGDMMDVDIFSFENCSQYFFKLPVAINAIATGDVIVHNGQPLFVKGFTSMGNIIGVDVSVGEEKTVLPVKSPFGFNFATKIISLFDGMTGADNANAANPFGNMLPLLMMEGNKDMDPMMLMLMASNMNGGNMFANPLMLFALMGNKDGSSKMDDMLMPFMLGQMMTQNAAPKSACKCSHESADTEKPTRAD